jgi:hypothetical protein
VTHVLQPSTPSVGGDARVRRHCAMLPESDRTLHEGVAVTTPERTLLDCLCYLSAEAALVVGDGAAWRRAVQLEAVRQRLVEAAGRRGVRRAGQVLELVRDGAESPGESLTRYALVRGDVPEPVLQHPVVTPFGVDEADMAWVEEGVVYEYDGIRKYTDPDSGLPGEVIHREKVRESRIQAEAGMSNGSARAICGSPTVSSRGPRSYWRGDEPDGGSRPPGRSRTPGREPALPARTRDPRANSSARGHELARGSRVRGARHDFGRPGRGGLRRGSRPRVGG